MKASRASRASASSPPVSSCHFKSVVLASPRHAVPSFSKRMGSTSTVRIARLGTTKRSPIAPGMSIGVEYDALAMSVTVEPSLTTSSRRYSCSVSK
eukprot:scaffold33_cov135-Pinguiococcus_pyrenoidosus.AAC.6